MPSDRYLLFSNPATGERFGQVPAATPEAVHTAVAEMRAAADAWAQTPLKQRIRVLRQFQAAIIEARDEISATITLDCGKSRQDALIEVLVTADLMHQAARNAPRWLRRERVPSGLYVFKHFNVEPRPYGVVAVISPWNFPFALAVPPLFAALLAGNTVVLKPSEVTAATGALIEGLIGAVPGLAPFVRVVHGDYTVGEALVHARPDLIFLIGSTATGKKVLRAAADHVIPVVCELGGKDAMLVLDDADLEAAAEWGAWGAYYNTGHTCMSVERVYAVDGVYDRFVERAVVAARRLSVSYSLDPAARHHLGCVACGRQMEVIEQHMADALARGARVLTGGRRNGAYYEPTVLVDVNHEMLVMREETFGPIMPIMRVRDQAEAICLANDSAFGLSASVWTRDLGRAAAIARQLRTGSVIVNDTIAHFGVPHLPFGGIKESGFGRTHGRAGLLQFTYPFSYATGSPPQPWDPATLLRRPGHYWLAALLLRVLFGVTLRQRLQVAGEALQAQSKRLGPRGLGLGLGAVAAAAAFVFGFWRRPASRR